MPFTPFHFGAHTCAALPFGKKLDIPAFLLANIVVDIEPLVVLTFNLNYPLHGYAHTFVAGLVLSPITGAVIFAVRKPIINIMRFLRLPYNPSLKVAMVSAFLGHFLHILFDAPIYPDIEPFYPFSNNPLYGVISTSGMYLICIVLFIPAIFLYFILRNRPLT